MKKLLLSILFVMMCVASAASNDDLDTGGDLNPDEMSFSNSLSRAARGDVNMVICSQGYLLTKSGNHEQARALFLACAEKGWTGTMTWMSYMEQNGFGGSTDAKAAAQWNKKAADLGDPIGVFNYGLDLLRGYGVEQNLELGRQYIDRAADKGVKSAKQLRAGDYDTELVTPDADSWKYEKRLY